jgi:hypothetical protein
MMRFVRRLSSVLLVSSFVASAAHAQTQLDAPSVRQVDSSHSSLSVEIEAGTSGAPVGFRVAWMKLSDFNANGGWPSDLNSPLLSRAQFYGTPTWNVSTGSYRLNAGDKVTIELGDLFDETGLASNNLRELVDQEPYVVHVQAVGTGSETASDQSPDLQATTKPVVQNCTFTQGYWKNHPGVWPVTTLLLGNVSYNQTQLIAILNQQANGNGLVSLAHQLIATKLSLANGADPTPIQATVDAADGLIGDLVVPPIGSGFLDPSTTDDTAHTLDQYNNGLLGVPHCGETATKPSTWGAMKGMYR